VLTLDELMKEHIEFMDKVGIPPLLRSRSLSPRPFQVMEQWRVKGLRKRRTGRSAAVARYVEARRST
jgi:hypothetical protein